MIAIHDIHRKMAQITLMSTNRDGDTVIGEPEIRLLIPLLRQNLELVRRLDELKHLSYQAYLMGEFDWMNDICAEIDALEATLI